MEQQPTTQWAPAVEEGLVVCLTTSGTSIFFSTWVAFVVSAPVAVFSISSASVTRSSSKNLQRGGRARMTEALTITDRIYFQSSIGFLRATICTL